MLRRAARTSRHCYVTNARTLTGSAWIGGHQSTGIPEPSIEPTDAEVPVDA